MYIGYIDCSVGRVHIVLSICPDSDGFVNYIETIYFLHVSKQQNRVSGREGLRAFLPRVLYLIKRVMIRIFTNKMSIASIRQQ